MEATVEIHRQWIKDEQAEESLMKRLNGIVSGSENGPFKKDDGYRWMLDGSNDWWAEIRDGKLILACRYSQEKLDALVNFCKVWLS